MRLAKFVMFLLVNMSSFSQMTRLEFLERSSITLLGLDNSLHMFDSGGLEIVETHSKGYEGEMADIILKSDTSVIIFYINDDCFATGFCNFIDLYTSKEVYDDVMSDVIENTEYKFIETFIDDLGICKKYIKGEKDTYPYVVIYFTSYTKDGEKKYLVSLQNSPGYRSGLKPLYRRRYKEYE